MTVLYRHAFPGEMELRESDDGRPVVSGRVVPFGVAASIVEPDDTGKLVTYREQFLPGCLERQAAGIGQAWNRVKFKLGHSDTLEREIGYGLELAERDDGIHGEFRLFDGQDLARVRSMLVDAYRGMSVEFRARRSSQDGDLISREEVYIVGVAATPTPAYPDALITSVREQVEPPPGTPNLEEVDRLLAVLSGASDGA